MEDVKVWTVKITGNVTAIEVVDSIVSFVRDGTHPNIREESLSEVMARGREKDCDCDLIQCVCREARAHQKDCRYRLSLSCPVAIECAHGLEVCGECDKCTCQ